MDILDLARVSRDDYTDPRIQLHRKPVRNWGKALAGVAAGSGFLFFALPAYAIFGLGDIVFDPSAYASLGTIMSSEASTLTKTIQVAVQTAKIAADGFQTLQIARDMAVMVTDKSAMKTRTFQAINGYTKGRFGETTDWDAVMSGDASRIAGAWKQSTVNVQDKDTNNLSNESEESSRRASLATLEAMDRAAQVCMATIGQSRTNTQVNEVARKALARLQTSLKKSDNSNLAALGQLNLGSMFTTNELVGLGQHGTCQDEMQLVAMKQKRDELATQIKRQADTANSQASLPTGQDGQATIKSLLQPMQ